MMSKLATGILAFWIATMMSAPLAWSQNDEEQEVDEEVVEEKIEALEEAREEGPVPDLITELTELFKKTEDKGIQRDIAEAIGEGMGSRNADVRLEAASALAPLGEPGAKLLVSGLRRARKELDLRLRIVQSMGKNADLALIGELTKLLNDKEFAVIAAAAEALGGYEGTKIPYRIKIVDQLLKIYTSAENSARDPKNTTAVRKNNMIKTPMNNTLYKLTGQALPSADAYRQWYSDARKDARAWPKGKDDDES